MIVRLFTLITSFQKCYKRIIFNIFNSNPLWFKVPVFLVLMLSSKLGATASPASKLDSLFAELDLAITKIPQVIDAKERIINNLVTDLVSALNDAQRYHINSKLYNECSKYNYDKAMMFLNNNLQLAEKNNNKRWRNESLLRQTKLLVSTIAFKEASNIFDEIQVETLDPDLLRSYYSIRQLYYFYLIEFSDKYFLTKYKEEYNITNNKLISLYDSAQDLSSEYEFQYSFCRAQPNEKLQLASFLTLIGHLHKDNPYYGATSASISNLYGRAKDHERWMMYLIQAAISDLSIATKEHSALQELALYLCETGDVLRAYKYIQISMQDAIAFNARHRITDASSKFMFIQSAYKHKEDVARRSLWLSLIIFIIISVIVLFFIIYNRRQSHKLLVANTQLNEVNSKYKTALHMLQEMAHSKDKYLVQILTMCSSFFEKQADFKKMLYKKVVNGKIDDINKTLKLSLSDNLELDVFYKLFDKAVNELFPDFVIKVNELFSPDKHIEIKSEKDLNAELRILALIRLGITDNAQISNFLRYSIGTIYTYRSKLRNNAQKPATFELDVAKIDRIELN